MIHVFVYETLLQPHWEHFTAYDICNGPYLSQVPGIPHIQNTSGPKGLHRERGKKASRIGYFLLTQWLLPEIAKGRLTSV